jgi:hypothetical protein
MVGEPIFNFIEVMDDFFFHLHHDLQATGIKHPGNFAAHVLKESISLLIYNLQPIIS